MKLHSYFRSSAAYRVRIALNLKGLGYDVVPVNLLNAEQRSDGYKALNPSGLVPTLELEPTLATGRQVLTQSLAIIEWLEAEHPTPELIPGDALIKAHVRSLAHTIGCDIHPMNNLRVLKYLQQELNASDEQKAQWYIHWITLGFEAFERQITGAHFCLGNQPTLADICLIPQVYNALRFNVPLEGFPKIRAIYQRCLEMDAFHQAAPEQQIDARGAT